VCRVYRKIGGHAYDSVYPGPIGAVLSPLLEGRERHAELPLASSLCGACSEVCSARIPLADYLLRLRAEAVETGMGSMAWSAGLRSFAEVTRRPRVWSWRARRRAGASSLRPQRVGEEGPGPLGVWTRTREFPALARQSFRRTWQRREPGD